jgi:hypothetical protein
MAAPNAKPQGNRWFMVGSLVVMAAVLVLLGLQLRKPATPTKSVAAASAEQPAETVDTAPQEPSQDASRVQ